MASLKELLCSAQCSQVGSMRPVVSLLASMPMGHAARALADHSIQSAPIIDDKGTSLIGVIDYQDINSLLLLQFDKDGIPADEMDIDAIIALRMPKSALAGTVIAHLRPNLPPPLTLSPTDSLFTALSILTQHGNHRLLLVKSAPMVDLQGILSQTDLLRYISAHLPVTLAEKTMSQLGLGRLSPMTISASRPLLEALLEMHQRQIWSVPLVNDNGQIVDTLSKSDLSWLFRRRLYSALKMSAVELAQMAHRHSDVHQCIDQLVITLDETFIRVANKLLLARMHRAWIVHHETRRPIGVVSVSDLLGAIVTWLASAATAPLKPLREMTCDDFPQPSPGRIVHTIGEKSTVQDVCRIIGEKGISSIPVVSANGTVIGMFDYFDLARLLVAAVAHHDVTPHTHLDEFINKGMLRAIPVNMISAITSNPVVTVAPNAPLLSTMAMAGMMPIIVMSTPIKKISPSELIRYLANGGSATPITTKRVGSIDALINPEIVTIKTSDTVVAALEAMLMARQSSAAVVDGVSGALIGNLSLSDAKYVMRAALLTTLASDVRHFIERVRQVQAFDHVTPESLLVATAGVSVTADAELAHAIQLMATRGIHRVWVVDQQSRPIGAIPVDRIITTINMSI